MQSIFGTDGIRGRFNKEITYSLAYKVGYALGSILEKKSPIIIGRDTRISGDILCLLYTSPSPRDAESSRMPSSA